MERLLKPFRSFTFIAFSLSAVSAAFVLNVPSVAMAKSNSPLGDLSSFEKLGKETLKLVEARNFDAAKKKITELETAWDKAEETLRPKDTKAWRYVDKSIDKALAKVRTDKPDEIACKEALKAMFEQMESPGAGKS